MSPTDWLEIGNTAWEEQYFEIMEFLDPYDIMTIGVDAQGMGSAVADRMQRLCDQMLRTQVTPVSDGGGSGLKTMLPESKRRFRTS